MVQPPPIPTTSCDGHSLTAELTALFATYLAALCDPQSGETLHRLHAPEALVRHGQSLAPAAAVAAADYAQSHHDLCRQGGTRLPAFSALTLLEAAQSGAEALAWFELTETRGSHRLLAALGARRVGNEWRLVWCAPARTREQWSFQDGLLQSLADYPWMRKADPAAPRTLFEAGFLRHFWRARERFSSLPDARFSCQMSAVCCRHDFEITVPPEAQHLIDAMPWERIKPGLRDTRLAARPDGRLQLKTPQETCRFLGARNQCLIHQTLGRQPFGTCCVFPFSFARTPEGIAVGVSPICGSARLGLGGTIASQEREDDLRERLAHAEPRSTDVYRLAPDLAVPWERFRDIEKGLYDCLAADLPLRDRLYVGSRLLGALRAGAPIDVNAWLAEPPVMITDELRAAIHGMLARISRSNRAVLRRLPPEPPAALRTLDANEPVILARILQNTLHCKVYSYPFDLTTAHNFLIVIYLVALLMQTACAGPLPDEMWRELGALGVHGMLRPILLEGMPEGFLALLGTPQFGQWLLGA